MVNTVINIGSGNGLVLDGTKPLPGPMLNNIYGTIDHKELILFNAVID